MSTSVIVISQLRQRPWASLMYQLVTSLMILEGRSLQTRVKLEKTRQMGCNT